MKKVLVFGSTGHLGKKIAAELANRGYEVTAVVRNKSKAQEIEGLSLRSRVADVLQTTQLKGICQGFDIVVSALGKSVSPNDRSKPTFRQVDLEANSAILQQATRSGVKKFVYVSALHAEKYPQLEYFRVHHEFSQQLKTSGLDYAIIKPPALFSAFLDMIALAKNGRLLTLGIGDKLTNPIYEGDLAKICADAVDRPNAEIEAGGREVLTRHQINRLIQQMVSPEKKVKKIPITLVKVSLPLLKIFSRNLFEKMAFFTEVMQHDTIAPQVGETRLAAYMERQITGTAKTGSLK